MPPVFRQPSTPQPAPPYRPYPKPSPTATDNAKRGCVGSKFPWRIPCMYLLFARTYRPESVMCEPCLLYLNGMEYDSAPSTESILPLRRM